VRLVTRGGLDWTHRYGDLSAAFRALPGRDAVIDGEIVVLDDRASAISPRCRTRSGRGAGNELVFFAFDLLHLDGWDLTAAPLDPAQGAAGDLLAGAPAGSPIQFSDHVEGGGPVFFEKVSELGLEGMISKRASAPYHPGRSKTWTKTKARLVGEFAIAGYTASPAAGGLGALALAEWRNGALEFRGKVGTGFDAAIMRDLLARLEPLRSGAPPLPDAPKDVIPVRPVLTARVLYSQPDHRRAPASRRVPRPARGGAEARPRNPRPVGA
jgi:bifunctional non-homologous end joining protein LigD